MLGVKLDPVHHYSIWTGPCEKGQWRTGSALLCEMLRGKPEPTITRYITLNSACESSRRQPRSCQAAAPRRSAWPLPTRPGDPYPQLPVGMSRGELRQKLRDLVGVKLEPIHRYSI